MSRLIAASLVVSSLFGAAPAMAGPVLEGAWTSDSGAVIACNSFRCDKILPGNGMVIDTFDYRLKGDALELRSLASGRVHHYILSAEADGAITGRSAMADPLRLEPFRGALPYENYVPFPDERVLSTLIELEAEPLDPNSADVDAMTAAR
ncbi:MAG: hypothetical protein AAF160_16345 [Pseudomonadota bacterium]